jgi:hypothetical protein
MISLYVEGDNANDKRGLVTSHEIYHQFPATIAQFMAITADKSETLLG